MANYNYEFRALGTYKNELFNLITDIANNPLCELLIDILMPELQDNRLDKVSNFIGSPPEGYEYYDENGNVEIVHLKKHLFDVPFIYSTVTDAINVICIDTNISRSTQSTKEMDVIIYIMCHKECLEIDSETKRKYRKLGYIGRNRLDIATAILGDILNGSNQFGIGHLIPTPNAPTRSYFPNNDFFGKVINYTCSDFMVDYSERSLYGE